MAPNSLACSFIHASMAGSRSTAPLNRSNSVLIIAPLSSFEISAYTAPLHEERKDAVGLRIATGSSATGKLELRGDIPASHMGSRSTTPLLRNPTDVRHCSQQAGANVDFGDEGAGHWAFLGNLKQLPALLLCFPPPHFPSPLSVVKHSS